MLVEVNKRDTSDVKQGPHKDGSKSTCPWVYSCFFKKRFGNVKNWTLRWKSVEVVKAVIESIMLKIIKWRWRAETEAGPRVVRDVGSGKSNKAPWQTQKLTGVVMKRVFVQLFAALGLCGVNTWQQDCGCRCRCSSLILPLFPQENSKKLWNN